MMKTFKKILFVAAIAPLVSSSNFICAMDQKKIIYAAEPYTSNFAIQGRSGNSYFKNTDEANAELHILKTFLQKQKIKPNHDCVVRSQECEEQAKKATIASNELMYISNAYGALLDGLKQDDKEAFFNESEAHDASLDGLKQDDLEAFFNETDKRGDQ